ncbi:MAG TPA: GNAT family N-acetyltransferase [Candidatus Limnocylindria bacterium]|nr:GNAT family N-acetyltransferase [Candidatus Limnocylindria bacterium]
MTIAPTAYRISKVDPRTATDAELVGVARLNAALDRERVPEDPPTPIEAYVRRYRAIPAMVEIEAQLATLGEDTVGLAFIFAFKADTNQDLREVNLAVHPGHRRRGLATELLRRSLEGLADDLTLTGYGNDRVPAGAVFAARVGAKPGLAMHLNQLVLADVDRALIEEWATLDPEGYRAVWITGNVPDELIENFIVAYDTMNTAPRGDLKMDDWKTTPEMVREWDRTRAISGRERWAVLVIEERTGETAGYTEVSLDPATPHVIGQQGTATIPAHRGRGIGKWMKALVIRRILAERPAARFIRTGNATSNAPMLAINTRLGFKPAWASTVYQVKAGDAKRALGL